VAERLIALPPEKVGSVMPVYPIFQNSAFDPKDIEVMSAAFEDVCRDLGFAVKDGVLRDIIAKVIIECAQKGIRNQIELRKGAHGVLGGWGLARL
jgi:hypothetical protein